MINIFLILIHETHYKVILKQIHFIIKIMKIVIYIKSQIYEVYMHYILLYYIKLCLLKFRAYFNWQKSFNLLGSEKLSFWRFLDNKDNFFERKIKKKKHLWKTFALNLIYIAIFHFLEKKKKIKILVEKYKNFVHENRNIGYILYI